MRVDVAFEQVGGITGAEQISQLFARMQRDRFTRGLRPGGGRVEQVIDIGSCWGKDPSDPTAGVDLLAVMSAQPPTGPSTTEALTALRGFIWTQVYGRRPDDPNLARNLHRTRRSVRCAWRDLSLRRFDGLIEAPPPVTVMPAYRIDEQIMVPGDDGWVGLPAEQITAPVEQHRRAWTHFTDLSRMTNAWNRCRGSELTSIGVDVLVLAFMPRPQLWRTLTRAEALARFLRTAADRLEVLRAPDSGAVVDVGVDYGALRRSLHESAALARTAADAAIDGDRSTAQLCWNQLIGNGFGPGWLMSTLRWIWQEHSDGAEVDAGWAAVGAPRPTQNEHLPAAGARPTRARPRTHRGAPGSGETSGELRHRERSAHSAPA